MTDKKNWRLTKKYLDYRFQVDQITEGSLEKEKTHLRYLILWAENRSFRTAPSIRPAFPEYLLSTRLDGEQDTLSASYAKKVLATSRMFFTWLSDNESGYRTLKQAWIKTLKVKRLTDIPKVREAVSLDEVLAIAAQEVHTVFERRTRAMAAFLYLSGMRIGAFVSLPLRAVDIPKRTVIQYPSWGVQTKNQKYGVTYLLDIPELLRVVQEWDDEVRAVLSPNGFWFAPLTPEDAEIDTHIRHLKKSRATLATKNLKAWMDGNGLPYHSPHKFRHGHIQYGQARSKSVADYKAVSLNVLHSSMEITDQFYSNIGNSEVQNRISNLGKEKEQDEQERFQRFLEWERTQE